MITTLQAILLFACMYAALFIEAELIYMILEDRWYYQRFKKGADHEQIYKY